MSNPNKSHAPAEHPSPSRLAVIAAIGAMGFRIEQGPNAIEENPNAQPELPPESTVTQQPVPELPKH